jgi:uncharacterized protein (TIGR00725 family)
MRKIVIGVMGPREAKPEETRAAFEFGRLIAKEGWLLLSGGGNEGVMDAVNQGAKQEGGTTIGIIWRENNLDTSEAVDIAIVSGMGSARNNINVLSSDVVVACGLGAGTASEICLAIKAKKPVVLLCQEDLTKTFFEKLGKGLVSSADTPREAIEITKKLLPKAIHQKV